jgi:hypothetical protein
MAVNVSTDWWDPSSMAPIVRARWYSGEWVAAPSAGSIDLFHGSAGTDEINLTHARVLWR